MTVSRKRNCKLTQFLERFSTEKGRKSVGALYKEWVLVEVRDAGRKDKLVCPCGRAGLRYLCFIRNVRTRVQTYVGSTCVRKFTHRSVPNLLKLMEYMSIQGVKGKFVKREGRNHHFVLLPTSKLVKSMRLMGNFFSKVPIYQDARSGCWVMKVVKGHTHFYKPTLYPGKKYNIKVSPVTRSIKTSRPELMFFADRIFMAYIPKSK